MGCDKIEKAEYEAKLENQKSNHANEKSSLEKQFQSLKRQLEARTQMYKVQVVEKVQSTHGGQYQERMAIERRYTDQSSLLPYASQSGSFPNFYQPSTTPLANCIYCASNFNELSPAVPCNTCNGRFHTECMPWHICGSGSQDFENNK